MNLPAMNLPSIRKSTQQKRGRQGATLMDVIAGSMLMSTLLIPSSRLMNESRANTHRLNVRQSLIDDAKQVMEQTRIDLSRTSFFDDAYAGRLDSKPTTPFNSFSVVQVHFEADKDFSPNELLTIVVDAWHDDDTDGQLDAGESVATLRTQFAAPEGK